MASGASLHVQGLVRASRSRWSRAVDSGKKVLSLLQGNRVDAAVSELIQSIGECGDPDPAILGCVRFNTAPQSSTDVRRVVQEDD